MIGRVAIAALLLAAGSAAAQLLDFSADELRAVLRHGPWPAPVASDPSNRVSGSRDAIELGERLFFEPRLSQGGKVLAAFQETLASGRSAFDDFRDAVERGDREVAARYPLGT